MSIKDLDANHGDTTYTFSLNGTDFAVGGENSSQDADNCIFIKDVQGQDRFNFNLIRQGVTIDLDPNGGTSFVTDLENGPHAKIVCDSLIENATGGRGNDVIYGNDVGNVIIGARGGDHLWGEDGADTFLYGGFRTSRALPGRFDTIEDFSSGSDFINLHKLHFDFVGHHAFSKTAHELRLTNHNVLLGDRNGDGHADFKIAVHGDHVLAADLIL